jgi:hypothetical protein
MSHWSSWMLHYLNVGTLYRMSQNHSPCANPLIISTRQLSCETVNTCQRTCPACSIYQLLLWCECQLHTAHNHLATRPQITSKIIFSKSFQELFLRQPPHKSRFPINLLQLHADFHECNHSNVRTSITVSWNLVMEQFNTYQLGTLTFLYDSNLYEICRFFWHHFHNT